ncbi:hypothetical protein ABW365_12645 [Enterococcus avium]
MGKMKNILVTMLILLFFGTSQISEAAGYLVYEVSFPLGTYTSSNDSSKEETKNAGASQSTTEGSDKKRIILVLLLRKFQQTIVRKVPIVLRKAAFQK